MLQVRLLGQFDIRMDGKRVTIPSRAGQSLLAYLMLTVGTAHRRERLAGILWPDTTDENARKNLRQELWRIRKAISTGQPAEKEYLLADEITLTFNRDSEYWLDVSQIERPDLDLQSLIVNLSLYQGELLPGFYDEWVAIERERIQAVFEKGMEQLLEQLIAAERWIAVQEWGERWLTLSGVREPAYRALMLASGVRGDMAKVASLYQRCTAELLENIGVEPSAETRGLYDGLLKGAKIPQRTSAAQPSGTITFLFTDIEGSTRLLEKLGDQYAVALGEHHEILRAAIQKWNGREVDTQGDAFFVTFTRALDAVRCAAEAQRALAAHPWYQGENLRVRMGLHTGEPLIASTGYVGMDVHRAARIGDAGHGGQILLSPTTRELVLQDLPEGLTIQDLGEHRLKDMKYPASIYQLVVDGLPVEFAPIRTKFSGTESPTPGAAPFKGLQFFDVDDSELFFGRETLTTKLMNRLQDANFLSVIIGASGSGKSSLVRAGLIPTLKKGNANWQIHILTPTAHPLEALAIELTQASESVTAAATLMDDLSKDPRSLHFFLSRQNASLLRHTLLVIDQFEELFTLCRDEFEREAFIDNLLAALTPAPLPLGEKRKGEGNLTLVITLRADFYAHLAQYPDLRDAVAQQQEYIGPMTTEDLRRAIEEPAQRGHWEFEPGLVDLILRDVGDEPGALPLLSHALLETWKRRAGHRLTLKGYADAGGVHGAIAHTAESVYQNLSLNEQTVVRNILLRLTEFGEGTEDTRRRASLEELWSHAEDADQVRAVLNKLAEARLVTLSEDSAEVAHEALIREWPKLREWLSQDREGIILHRNLTEAAHEWELLERDSGSVYRGARLAQANEWFVLNPSALNAQERMFLEASNMQAKGEEQEREAGLQRERDAAVELAETQRQSASRLRIRNRVITSVGTIAVILAILAGLFGVQSNQNAVNAQAQQQVAFERELSASAISNLSTDPERSILLSLEAVNISLKNDQPVLIEAQDALHRSIQTSRVLATLRGHDAGGSVWALDVSPDGKHLATIGDDRTVRIWDLTTNEVVSTLQVDTDFGGGGHGVAFSPDGRQLLTVSGEANATLWDVSTGNAILKLEGHSDLVATVGISHNGKMFATGSYDGTTKLWDATTGKELFALGDDETFASYTAFSPDGKILYTGGDGFPVTAWDTATGEKLFTSSEPGGGTDVTAIASSPDGMRMATGDFDTTVKIWDATSGNLLLKLFGHSSYVNGLAFSPDGKTLATASEDGSARLWDAETGKALLTLSGHASGVLSAAFSADGKWLYTASRDGTAKVWDISPSAGGDALNLVGHTNRVATVAYRPDGKQLATFGWDGTIRIWDAVTGEQLHMIQLEGEYGVGNGYAGNVTYSPDGKLLAYNDLNTTRIINVENGDELMALDPFESGVLGVVFSPDGKLLADAGVDGTVRIHDSGGGKTLLEFVTGEIQQIVFSPDEKRLAIAAEDGAYVYDVTTGKLVLKYSGHGEGIRNSGIAFSPDGKWIASSGNDSTIKVWDAETGADIFTLAGHTGPTFGVLFSSDGGSLITSSVDGTVKVWVLPKPGESIPEPLTLYGNTGAVYRVALSPDGTRIVSVGRDHVIHIYELNIDKLIDIAKSRLTRTLTTEECQKYLHMATCPSTP
jgi:WD40 repeat protein/DNA-binding SARP family transcriptional activator